MKTQWLMWLVLVIVSFTVLGCDDPYTERRVIREGPVVEQREVVR